MIRNCQHILTKSQQNIVENILLPSNNKKMNSHKEPVMNLAMDFYETSPKAYQVNITYAIFLFLKKICLEIQNDF